MNVLVCDPVSPKGIALLQQRPEFKVTVLSTRLPEPEFLPLAVPPVDTVSPIMPDLGFVSNMH